MFFQNVNFSRGFNFKPALFIIFYQLAVVIFLPFYLYYYTPSLSLILLSVAYLYICGLSITAGYHRYFSHKSYKTSPIIESILLFFGAMSLQGSALRWSYDHRLHHAFVDTDDDPYSIKKGFWYAHWLWLLEEPRDIEEKTVSDLMKNKRVMFQHRFSNTCMILSNVIAFGFSYLITKDFLGSLLISFGLRLFCLHHFTWFINSLAHTWGDKPFSQEQTAVNNFVISLLTFGEGYHNYHHTYANDYRNGVKWYHFDPTKWLIWSLSKVGLADHLRTVDAALIRKRMVLENKDQILQRLTKLWYVKKEDLEKAVLVTSESILQKLQKMQEITRQYRQAKKQNESQEHQRALKKELKKMRKTIKQDWKEWKQLTKNIMYLKPLPMFS